MKFPLHVLLHLHDAPNDAALVRSILEGAGISCKTTCVQTRDEFVDALEHGFVDLVLSDLSLPSFDGLSALKLAHGEHPELPVVLLIGILDEEVAIESMKSGATDYVLKGRLARLAPVVRRAMKEVEERAQRKRLEAQLIEAQKMEVIGQLASGVAHDFNNVLAVIYGCCERTLSKLSEGDPLREYVQEIDHAAERAAGLARQLLVFSRRQTVQPVVLDFNDVVTSLDGLLRRLIDENIEMTVLPGQEIGRVKADPGYVGQVLMNLVVNARDAMPDGGKLTVTTSNATLDDEYARTHAGALAGEYVMLRVSDTGTGMTEEVAARLFEPFFTTKPKGKGTGLGLSTCRTIVQQSGGHIGVHSEPGKGATFKVYFPRVEQPLNVAPRSIPTGALARGTETLMVVEDDPSVRRLACVVLESQGYEVLWATNGQHALQVAREHEGSPIRLVVTDVIMPVMGGKVMAEWLRTTHPHIRILFTSGYTDDVITHHGVLEPGVEFLSKPYTPSSLSQKVRTMLDEKSARSSEMEQGVASDESIPVTS